MFTYINLLLYIIFRKGDKVTKNLTNVFEDVSIAIGLTISIDQIKTIFGIVLLAFQIVLIIWKVGTSVYKHIKNRELDKVEKDLQDGINQIEDLTKKSNDK